MCKPGAIKRFSVQRSRLNIFVAPRSVFCFNGKLIPIVQVYGRFSKQGASNGINRNARCYRVETSCEKTTNALIPPPSSSPGIPISRYETNSPATSGYVSASSTVALHNYRDKVCENLVRFPSQIGQHCQWRRDVEHNIAI